MKKRILPQVILFLFCFHSTFWGWGALPTTITFQGQLKQNGQSIQGRADLQFQLFSEATNGLPQGNPVTREDVFLRNGLFSVELDFGAAAFNNSPRWIQIAVRSGTNESFSVLAPRQMVFPTPYSLFSAKADSVSELSVSNSMLAANSVTFEKIAAGEIITSLNSLTDDVNLIQGDSIRINTAVDRITISAVNIWKVFGNAGLPAGTFLGTLDNQAVDFRVANSRALRLEPGGANPNIIGGNSENSIVNGVIGGTIGGGARNSLSDPFTTIGGGQSNHAGNNDGDFNLGRFATVDRLPILFQLPLESDRGGQSAPAPEGRMETKQK